MATRAQKAASRKNIKKAQAARRRKSGAKRRKPVRRRSAAARKPVRRRRAAAAAANPRRRKPVRRRAAANPKRRRKPARRRAAANPVVIQAAAPLAANPVAANPRRRRRRAAANPKPAANPSRRRRSSARRRANPVTPITVKVNPWPGQPRRHAKAAKKGWRKRRAGKSAKSAGRRRTTKRCKPCRPKRSRTGQFTGGFARRELALSNPMSSSMSSNPLGYDNPFETKGIMSYGTAVAGLALGAIVADVVDRIVATRKPMDKEGSKGVRPWYGRDAAAAQRMRPDAWRLGAQAAGAVVSLGLAFWGRNIKFVPWLLGGTALGFGVNLLTKIADWYLMPTLFKVKDPTEVSLANRLYPLEQDAVQKEITALFANWNTTPVLMSQQQTDPAVSAPLSAGSIGVGKNRLSGKAETQGAAAGVAGADSSRQFLATGRLGYCSSCNGQDGCYSDCATLCPNCDEYNPNKECKYVVQEGDDLVALAGLGRVGLGAVNAMNGGTPDTYWRVGNTVKMPYGMCMAIDRRPAIEPVAPSTPFPSELGTPPAPAAPAPTSILATSRQFDLANLGTTEEAPES